MKIKGIGKNNMRVKRKIAKRTARLIPESLYPFIATLYWHLHPNRLSTSLTRLDESWYAERESIKIIFPRERPRPYIHGIANKRNKPYKKLYKLQKGDICIVAGASIGIDVMEIASTVGEEGEVVAIEPEPLNLEYLRKNVQLNDFRNVEIVGKGLWSEQGTTNLFLTNNTTHHSVVQKEIMSTGIEGNVTIQTATLDDILVELGINEVDLLFMNIEGAELEALKGAKKTLQLTRNITVSCHRNEREGFETVNEAEEILYLSGFNVRRNGDMLMGSKNA